MCVSGGSPTRSVAWERASPDTTAPLPVPLKLEVEFGLGSISIITSIINHRNKKPINNQRP